MYSKMQGRAVRRGNGTVALDAVRRDGDDLAVLDLAHELGADDVERAGLRRQHVGLAEPAQHQRADADRIAGADQHVVGEADQRIGALDLPQRLHEPLDDAPALRARHQVQDDLGVGGRLADGAVGDELAPQRQRVGEVAVVGEREAAGVEVGKQRLHVAQDGVAGCRVAVVAERDVALEAPDHVGLVEVVADEPEPPLGVEVGAVVGDDAGGLLAAMLQGVETERGQGRRVLVAEHAEHPALLSERVAAAPKARFVPGHVLVGSNRHDGLSIRRGFSAPGAAAALTSVGPGEQDIGQLARACHRPLSRACYDREE